MVLHAFDMNMQMLGDKKITICLVLFLLDLFLDGELSLHICEDRRLITFLTYVCRGSIEMVFVDAQYVHVSSYDNSVDSVFLFVFLRNSTHSEQSASINLSLSCAIYRRGNGNITGGN